MNEKNFQDYLSTRGFNTEEIEKQVDQVKIIESILQKNFIALNFTDLNAASVQMLVNDMIDCGENSLENILALVRYAKAIDNREMFTTVFEMLDGCEVMDNLSIRLSEVVGEELRDIIFEGMPLPPLGLSKREKARYTYRIMRRMEEIFEERIFDDVLSDSLRDLPETYYGEARSDFFEVSEGDIDRYLILKGEKFLTTLIDCQQRNELFFGQEITAEVIDFVRDNPEIGGGIRDGNIIYETKIPFNTKAYLEETDPELKRYHYCHCPWVKESLRNSPLKVPATFCQCSAGFHKKPYEVIYDTKLRAEVLQSILNGNDICRFAIYLPEEREESNF